MRLIAALSPVQPLFIDKNGKFADGQTINVRNLELAHEGMETGLHITALHLVSSERIRTVKHHYLNAFLSACTHDQTESTDESIGAGADILDIINHNVNAIQHFL